MAASREDWSLCAAITRGDAAACNTFYTKYRHKLEWIARRRGVRLEDCSDIAQDALFAAFSQIQRGMFRGDSSLGTWLETIVHGTITNYMRAPGKRPIPGPPDLKQNQILSDVETMNLSVSSPDVEHLLTIRQVMNQLPPQHRVILILHKVRGYTIAEIARKLRWPSGTVGRISAEAQRLFQDLYKTSEKSSAELRQSIRKGHD